LGEQKRTLATCLPGEYDEMICPSATMRAIATIAVAFGRLVTNFSLSANGPGYSCYVEQQAGGSGGLRYFGRDKLRA